MEFERRVGGVEDKWGRGAERQLQVLTSGKMEK